MRRKRVAVAPAKLDVRGSNNNREVWAVDCETDPFKRGRIPKPFLWGAYNGSEYREFKTGSEFVAFIRERNCLCYAHNGGRFDWHYILDDCDPFSDIMVIAGRVAKFRIGEAEFRDSYNIMPMPLRAGGQKFEVEDFSIFESESREIPSNREIIRERCRTDCIYLYQLIEKFFAEFGLHLTVSAASMHAWHKISKEEKPETSSEFYARLAPYYFGGRVECFQSGIVDREFKVLDINSAYAFAMLSEHPYGDTIYEQNTLPARRADVERSFITLSGVSQGALPFRERGGSLTFPSDGQERTFCVTGWEYFAALETRALGEHRIHSVLQLPVSLNFRSYMDHFYGMKTDAKEAKDDARYEFAKKFLCSLYGKFGSNPEEYQEFTIVEPRYIEAAENDPDKPGYRFCAEIGRWALLARPLSEEKQRFYNVAVAASVTGFVRAYLWRAIRQSRGVLYVDTDCMHVVDSGAISPDPSALGAWKHEVTCNFGAYAGKKLYAVKTIEGKWKTASKGVRLTPDEIVKIATGEDFLYDPEVPHYSIKRGIQFQTRKIRKTA